MLKNIKQRILITEDDVNLGYLAEQIITAEGFQTTRVKNGKSALIEIDKNIYSLYIIDIGLPDISGLELVDYIRKKGVDTPIIIITDSIEDSKELDSFKKKASIFHRKPIKFQLLVTQINNFLKSNLTSKTLSFDTFEIIETNHSLTTPETQVSFSRAEYILLTMLIKSRPRVFSRDEIINRIMDRSRNSTYNSVDTLVSRVRKKLKDANLDNLILTEHNLGYKINSDYCN